MTVAAPPAKSLLFDPETQRLNLHIGQQRMWDSTARRIVVVSGHQGGKTESGAHWLLREMQNKGPGDGYAVTSTYPLFEVKFQPTIHQLFHDYAGWRWEAGKQQYISRDKKSRLMLRSAQSPGGLEAGTGIAAWEDECGQAEFPLQAHEAIERRMSVNQGRILMTTMAYNMGWFYHGPYMLAKGGDPEYELIEYASTENPNFPWERYDYYKRILPDWKFRMFILGEFTRPAGLIYSDFDDFYSYQERDDEGRWLVADMSITEGGPYGHSCRAFQIPPTWLRSVGVDFGGTEHTALTWWAEQPGTGIWFGYREAIGGGLSGAEHARAALEYREPVKMWVGGAGSEDDARESWARAGVPVIEPFFPGVEEGIDRLVALLRERRVCIFDTMTGLRGELGTYSRELDASGEPTMKIQDKARFHICDSARYWASTVPFNRPRPPREAPSTEGRTLAAIREHAKLLGVRPGRRM